ncbi:MAG: AraC family transcriptional regulator [Sphingobacteriaceae bacterium]
MKLVQTQITPFVQNLLHIELRDQAYFFSPHHGRPSYHAHPEMELTFVLEGYGKRIIGNNISNFEAGDMVLIGAGVPHIWLSDPAFYEKNSILRSRGIVTYVNLKIFEQMFELLHELGAIIELIKQANQGIHIYGKTRTAIADKLLTLSNKTGMEKVNGFFDIFHHISISSEKKFISEKELFSTSGPNCDRLIDVIKFIKSNINVPISLTQVADIACMTIPSFCRFFKNRTKMRFSQYLTDERMAHACKLLIELDQPISNIANLCGYNSDSHFCKVFKDHTGQSPYQFKMNGTFNQL